MSVRSAAVAALLVLAVAGCSHSGPTAPPARTPPDLSAFLRLPVATPSACPAGMNGTTSGRRSPWVGHVDVSVFVAAAATPGQVRSLGRTLATESHVAHVYTETKAEAYAEFQRLYTCSAGVSPSAVPASYRLVLGSVTVAQRDELVRRIYRLPGVDSVSCDPASPCVNIRPIG